MYKDVYVLYIILLVECIHYIFLIPTLKDRGELGEFKCLRYSVNATMSISMYFSLSITTEIQKGKFLSEFYSTNQMLYIFFTNILNCSIPSD